MKFTAGRWKLRDHVHAIYPASIHEIHQDVHGLRLLASDRKGNWRAKLLNAAQFTVDLSCPLPNIICVRLTRHRNDGSYRAGFQLDPDLTRAPALAPPPITRSDNLITLASGQLRAEINTNPEGPWQLRFYHNSKFLTGSVDRGTAEMKVSNPGTPPEKFLREALGLSVGETIYGLGERFTPTVKNGQVVESWNEDGGTCSEIAYKSIPFYLSSRGYGVLVNHAGRVSFEVGSEYTNAVHFSAPGQTIEYFIISGETLKDVLTNYTALTGRPGLPPPWSFGLWLTTSFLTSYDEATVNTHLEGMAQRNIPLHVFHFDCCWMREGHWCDFQWDPAMFPDPAAMLARMKAKGLKICVWINPYIGEASPLFTEGVEHGYLLKRPDGSVYQIDDWQPGMAIVDFTNPAARRWFQSHLRALVAQGVDCFKTDFGERIPTDVQYHDRSDPDAMHNRYSVLYNQTVYEVLAQEKAPEDPVLFARSASVGGQKFPVHWGGDSNATFESMAETLRGGLSLGLSGFGFWSHDISGFENTATPELYKRWVAFGLLSSHSRLHGSNSVRVPWAFDEESCHVLRHFVRLKCALMPYLWRLAKDATRTGVPMLRHMLLEFPNDPACQYLDRQYMLGESLLVAPIFDPDGWCDYYLPAGTWTDLLRNITLTVGGGGGGSGRWIHEQFDAFHLPLFVRENTVLPIGNVLDRPDYDYANGAALVPFALTPTTTQRLIIPSSNAAPAATFEIHADPQGHATIVTQSAATSYAVKTLAELDLQSLLHMA